MNPRSSKAKGRRACVEVKELLHKLAPTLEAGDIVIPTGSVSGADIHLSPAAKRIYPLAIESKNQQSLNIWAALKQADTHINQKDDIPVVFFKRNHSKMYAALDAETFLSLLSLLSSRRRDDI